MFFFQITHNEGVQHSWYGTIIINLNVHKPHQINYAFSTIYLYKNVHLTIVPNNIYNSHNLTIFRCLMLVEIRWFQGKSKTMDDKILSSRKSNFHSWYCQSTEQPTCTIFNMYQRYGNTKHNLFSVNFYRNINDVQNNWNYIDIPFSIFAHLSWHMLPRNHTLWIILSMKHQDHPQ